MSGADRAVLIVSGAIIALFGGWFLPEATRAGLLYTVPFLGLLGLGLGCLIAAVSFHKN